MTTALVLPVAPAVADRKDDAVGVKLVRVEPVAKLAVEVSVAALMDGAADALCTFEGVLMTE